MKTHITEQHRCRPLNKSSTAESERMRGLVLAAAGSAVTRGPQLTPTLKTPNMAAFHQQV